MRTLVDLLEHASGRHGDRLALAMQRGLRTERWSYATLLRESRGASARLRAAGLEPGDRVLLYGPNSPRLAASMLAVLLARGVVVPLDLRTPESALRSLAEVARPRMLLADGPPPALLGVPIRSLADLFRGEPPTGHAPVVPAADDLAEIVFTSGTTGNPKGVVLTHGNILANVRAMAAVVPATPADQGLSILPLSHMLEQTGNFFLPMLFGASVVYLTSRRSSAIRQTLVRDRVTTMTLVPEVLHLLLQALEREVERRGGAAAWEAAHRLAPALPMAARRALFWPIHRRMGGRLRLIVCGGAYLSPELWDAWERMGFPVVQGYGATECAPVVTCNARRRRVRGSVGCPLPGLDVKTAEDGELLVRGPSVSHGYWRDSDTTAEAFRDGWYHTGDLAQIGRHGDVFLKGRKKDLVVLQDGRNVYPEDVERELTRESVVRDSVVLGRPRGNGGVALHAAIIPSEAARSEELEEAVRRANSRLGPHQQVGGMTIWAGEDFPRTPTLKVKRGDVARVVLDGQTPDRVDTTTRPPVAPGLDRLVPLLRRAAANGDAPIGPETDLQGDLGLDSLGRVELAVLLQEEFGVDVPDEQIVGVRTVKEIAALLGSPSVRVDAGEPPRWALARPARLIRGLLQRGVLFPLLDHVAARDGIRGQEHLRDVREPILVVANHASHLDAPLILSILPRRLRERTAVAAAADYFFARRGLGFATSTVLNGFPFAREGGVSASLQYCGELVDRGWSVLIFPEGGRSPDGRLREFKTGIGLLARDLAVPVVPIHISGAHAILPKGASLPRPGTVAISIGAPTRVPPAADAATVASELHDRLARLAAERL